MKWALLSVWDKRGILDLARTLDSHHVKILSSGGTGLILKEAGIDFTEVSAYTGSPELMDGRVKTLHPKVHGGLLARRGIDEQALTDHGIHPIDLLVANLYPFEEMAASIAELPKLVDYIDIGGPAMIRAAAKNYHDVAVITDPSDYDLVGRALDAGGFSLTERFSLAKKAFAMTAAYEAAISNRFQAVGREVPGILTLQFRNMRELRYGENPHQKGAVYGEGGIAGVTPFQGREMSYNNYLDLHAAAALAGEFGETAAVIVKHNNPCGVAVGEDPLAAYLHAREVDPVSAYGSIVALNREVGVPLADEVCSTFVELLAAPSFTPDALVTLGRRENMRVVTLPGLIGGPEIRSIDGGLLWQATPPYQEHWKVVTDRDATPAELRALRLAWKVCKHTRSNAIVFADQVRTLGIGAGQMSRVDAAKIAIDKSLHSLEGSVVASDAFLPFPDTLEISAAAGATALVQPGGSIRDNEAIAAANALDVAMVFTGIRYFRH
jgi:phosphoribosylaminoimidazolecarboxamide formyltransferase/IMP cyclohydrolase